MTDSRRNSNFLAHLLRPATPSDADWAFVVLPKEVSETLPRRGRTSVIGEINGHEFTATLEPDGQKSHWLQVTAEMQGVAGVTAGDEVTLGLEPVEVEPEPDVPMDFADALTKCPAAQVVWENTTTLARVDWIHWIVTAKQDKTRAKRIRDACDKLSSGERRVCCFDTSGFYSKALSAPTPKIDD